MNPRLVILAEGESDALFFERCVEQITSRSFASHLHPIRHGGTSGVRKHLADFANSLRGCAGGSSFFIVSMDNDRRSAHPNHDKARALESDGCRFCALERGIVEKLGHDKSRWSCQGSIVVPVEMLESWLLLCVDEEVREEDFPRFKHASQSSAKRHYGGNPPAQLRDRVDQLRAGQSLDDFILEMEIDIASLLERSGSFELFAKQVEAWDVPAVSQ